MCFEFRCNLLMMRGVFSKEAGKYPKMKKTSLGMSEMVYLNICQKWYHGFSMENDDDASTF